MKIALINQPTDGALPPRQTSLSIWSYQVARRLASRCSVTVYDRRSSGRPVEERVDGVRYRHVAHWLDKRLMPRLMRGARSRDVGRPAVSSRWYAWGYAREVARDLRRHGCDLAVVFNFSQFAPVIRRWNPRTKIALAMHCEWLSQFDRVMCRRRLRGVDTIWGCSEHVVSKVRARFPDFNGACAALYNGVDVEAFADASAEASDDERPRILFVGRISPEKGLHVLLEALVQVRRAHPQVVLEIVGAAAPCPREILVDLSDDPRVRALARFYGQQGYHEHLQAEIERLDLADHVVFTGFFPHTRIAERYAAADVLVNPSLSEAFGMSLAEAMAAGLPCVATRVGGMPEVMAEDETGLLVPPDDPAALAAALIELLNDADRRRTMGEAGRVRARQRFCWDRIADDLLALAEGAGAIPRNVERTDLQNQHGRLAGGDVAS